MADINDMLRFVNATFAFLLFMSSAEAGDISGSISVIDADTIKVGSATVRLHGIDAPEKTQSCEVADGRAWECGKWAARQVVEKFEGASASCNFIELDKYNRSVAKCFVDGADISKFLVTLGIAQAYTKYSLDYVDAEKLAFFEKRGIWRGYFECPEVYRFERRLSEPPPDPNCAIKGNISQNGKIFHTPGQRDYEATKINLARGERWFCSVRDAIDAGWRAALR